MRAATGLLASGVVIGVVVACSCVGTTSVERASVTESAAPRRTTVVLLGTGTPNAEPERAGSAVAVVVGESSYLVDCGAGIVRRASAAARTGIDALAPAQLRRVFLTHLHSDHTVGLPDLLLTPWVLGRDVPLEVYGPPGTAAMVDHVMAAWSEDVRVRLNGLEPTGPGGQRALAAEVTPGVVYRDELVTVEAFAVVHGSFDAAYGYRFTTPDGVVVISGDTCPFPGFVDIARGAAVLVHEAYATAGFARREPDWQRYHAAFHTPGRAVGELAERAGVGAVVLTHQLLWGADEQDLVDEVRSAYRGPVFYGRDLDAYALSEGHVGSPQSLSVAGGG